MLKDMFLLTWFLGRAGCAVISCLLHNSASLRSFSYLCFLHIWFFLPLHRYRSSSAQCHQIWWLQLLSLLNPKWQLYNTRRPQIGIYMPNILKRNTGKKPPPFGKISLIILITTFGWLSLFWPSPCLLILSSSSLLWFSMSSQLRW